MAYGYQLQAEYEDGWVLTEDGLDQSPYDPNRNVFHAILNSAPVLDHGSLVRFSAIGNSKRYDIDWRDLPSNARPIYFRDMVLERDVASGDTRTYATRHVFGYQFNTPDGRNHKEIKETREI